MQTSDSRPYWAAEPDIKKLAPRCLERFSWHMSLLQRSGRWRKMRSMLSAYYGQGTDGFRDSSELQDVGDDDEVTALHTNQVRPVINNTLSLIAGTDPAVKARAKNEDAKSLAQTRLAQSLLESYDATLAGKEREIDVVRGALMASAWTLGQAWLPQAGKEWARGPEGEPLYEGDVDLFVLPPWRVIYDFSAADEAKRKWCLFRRSVSRFDAAAQAESRGDGETAKKLRQTQERSETSARWARESGASSSMLDALLGESLPDEDVLWVWELRHLPSPALPQGRLVRFVEPDVVLWDSLAEGVEYPYDARDLHLYEYAPERVVSSTAGHTGAFDLGAMQEFMDICTASAATTVNINGQMHLWSQEETPPNVHDLSSGNTVLTGRTKPEPIEYPALKPEVLAAADWTLTQMRQAMALNNVVMGQPDKGMPANAQALQRAQAMQYHAVAQAERVRLRQRNANGILKLLKRFARSPRTTEMVGKARAYELQEWQASDIDGVVRFDVEPVNPMSATFEGRQSLLELFMQMGAIREPDAALTFLQTGSLATITQTQTAQRELVEANVALLQRGIGPPLVDIEASMEAGSPQFIEPEDGQEVLRILKSDPHHLAVPAYVGVLASPSTRKDAALMQACTEAIQLSMEYWASLTPDEAMAFGVPPLPSQMAMAMPGAMPPAPSDAPTSDAPSLPDDGQPEEPQLPKPPDNPLTGEESTEGMALS